MGDAFLGRLRSLSLFSSVIPMGQIVKSVTSSRTHARMDGKKWQRDVALPATGKFKTRRNETNSRRVATN